MGSIELQIAGENIKSTNSEKLLGLHVSASFSWKTHVEKLIIKMKQRLSILSRLRYEIPKDKLKIVGEAIFTSLARYGIAVYCRPRIEEGDPINENLHQLQVLQNKMIRLIEGKKQSDMVNMKSLRSQIGMMSINQIACYHILIETYNIINFGSSNNIKEKLLSGSNKTRKTSFIIPLIKKNSCQEFTYFSARLFNKLPESIRILALNRNASEENCKDKMMECKQKYKAEEKYLLRFKLKIKEWIMTDGIPS